MKKKPKTTKYAQILCKSRSKFNERGKKISLIMFALQTENTSLKHNLVAGVPRPVLCYCASVEDGNFFSLKASQK